MVKIEGCQSNRGYRYTILRDGKVYRTGIAPSKEYIIDYVAREFRVSKKQIQMEAKE